MLAVLHADEHLVAVDKPPGRIVVPGRGPAERTVRQEAEEQLGPLWVVHRLDRGTSGVLLFARTAAAHRALNIAFEHHQVTKRYLALVRGAPPARLRLDAPLAAARRGRMRPAERSDPRGRAAATEVTTLEVFPAVGSWPALALVEAFPETGRTHQIRVHLAWGGLPLAVDPDYGDPGPLRAEDGAPLLERTPLHASRLAFDHPATRRPLVVEAPLPEDLARTLAALRRRAAGP